jgi:hypothetical protein
MRFTKYGNKKKAVNGITFHSKKEADRYLDLLLLEKCGKIECLMLQLAFPIIINDIKVFTYKCDFRYVENGEIIIEDVKGFKTAIYKLKKKCVEAQYGIKIRET